MHIQFSQHHLLEKTILSPTVRSCHFCGRSFDHMHKGVFLSSLFYSISLICLFLCQYHAVWLLWLCITCPFFFLTPFPFYCLMHFTADVTQHNFYLYMIQYGSLNVWIFSNKITILFSLIIKLALFLWYHLIPSPKLKIQIGSKMCLLVCLNQDVNKVSTLA